MRRAILFLVCTVIFTLTPFGALVNMASKTNEWHQFIDQYRYLIDDGKYDLAERLLHNRLPEMEQLTVSLPPEDKETFTSILSPVLNGHVAGSEQDDTRFLIYLEILTSEEPSSYIQEYLKGLKAQLASSGIGDEQVIKDWNTIFPAMSIVLTDQQVNALNRAMVSLDRSATYDARQEVYEQLDRLIESENQSDLTLDALLWTVIIVGGSIIITLAYVGLRKFQADVHHKKSRGRDNS